MQIFTCPFCDVQINQFKVCGYARHPANGCQLENLEILNLLFLDDIKEPKYQYALIKLTQQSSQYIKNFFKLLGSPSMFNHAFLKMNFDKTILIIRMRAEPHSLQEVVDTSTTHFRPYFFFNDYRQIEMNTIKTGHFDKEYFDLLVPIIKKLSKQTARSIRTKYHPCCPSCSHGNEPCTDDCYTQCLAVMS